MKRNRCPDNIGEAGAADRFGKKAILREKGGVSTLITDPKRKASIHSRVNGMKKEERREREREINLYKKKNIYEQIHKYHRRDRSNDGESEVREAEKRKNNKKKKSGGGKAMLIRRGNIRAARGIGRKYERRILSGRNVNVS